MFSAIFKLVALGVNTAVAAPLVVGAAIVDDRLAHRVVQLWAHWNLVLFGITVRSERRAPLDPTMPYVFMANHRSHLDVLAVIEALDDMQLRWVAKRELVNVPLFGWALKHAGHIIVDRADTTQAVASMRAAKAQMGRGTSVIIFPEGTRADTDAALLPLKKGGFMLALETETPIVPVAVRGSRALLRRDAWRIHAGRIDVVVGAPIATHGAVREQLMARVEAFLHDELHLPTAPRVPVAEVS